MLRLIVPLLAVLTYGSAANIDKCSWGESYWCSGIENAVACGAFAHCKSTVWKNQVLKLDDSETCKFCESIITDVENFVKNNETEQTILRFMKKACSMIPVPSVSQECTKIAENFLVQIIETVVSDLKPKAICSLIKLCAGFEDTVPHGELPAVQPVTKFIPLSINSEPICTDCKKFFTDIKNLIVSQATEEQIEALIDQALCAHLGSFEEECKNLVKVYLPEILTLLTTEFDPNMICQSFGFCTQTLKEAETFLIKLKLKTSDFYKTMSNQNSAEGCLICKTVLKEIQDLDRNPDVQTKIENFFKTELCARLGTYKATCNTYVDQYSPLLFQFLATELDPDTRCRSLGFCPATNTIRDVTRESTPIKKPVSTSHVADSPQCILCEFVMNEIDSMISKNSTKQEIIAAVQKVCNILPDTVKKSCQDFVRQYGEAIIDMLVQQLQPKVICTLLGLCSSQAKEIPPIASTSNVCLVCQTVIQYMEALLQENATIVEIEQVLEKVCNFLPDNIRPECHLLVSTYGRYLIEYISTAMTPKAICELVHACPTKMISPVDMTPLTEAKVVKNSHKLLGDLSCTYGPTYWCASHENAKACQATTYCELNGWNF